jgi:hypothetical protein
MREERKCGAYIPLGLPRGESQSAIASVWWRPIRGSYPDSPSAALKKTKDKNKVALRTFLLHVFKLSHGTLQQFNNIKRHFTISTAQH